MKTLKALILCTILPFVGKVEAVGQQTSSGELLAEFGNEEWLIDRAVTNSDRLSIVISQGEENSFSFIKIRIVSLVPEKNGVRTRLCHTKDDVEREYRTLLKEMADQYISDPALDKSLPVRIRGITTKGHRYLHEIILFFIDDEYRYQKGPDGNYSTPDFSDKILNLYRYIYIDILNLSWGRIEVASYGSEDDGLSPQSVQVVDTRYGPTEWIDTDSEVLRLPTEIVRRAGFSKIAFVGGTTPAFKVFGSSGYRIPEIPIKLCEMTATSFKVTGEPGRTVRILTKESFGVSHWTDTGKVLSIPSYGPVTYEASRLSGFFIAVIMEGATPQ